MKKINRIFNRAAKRVSSFMLAMLLMLTAIFTSMSMAGFVMPTIVRAEDGDSTFEEIEIDGEVMTIRDNALHFIFRHWHTSWDYEATMQSSEDGVASQDQYDSDTQRYFVMVEGYIIPHTKAEMQDENKKDLKDPQNKYTIVLVNQRDGSLKMASELYDDYEEGSYEHDKDRWTDNKAKHDGNIVLEEPTTPYLGSMNKTTGTIELKVKKLHDATTGDDIESFCGVSLSAGRGASELVQNEQGETDTIRITYNESNQTHIVKGHIFYNSRVKTVAGTADKRLTGENGDIDVSEVYTWAKTITVDGTQYEAGDLVEYVQEGGSYKLASKGTGEVIRKGEEEILKAFLAAVGRSESDVRITTFYSSAQGLHTNKTLMQSVDGRFFLFDLEAWYIEGVAAQLGYALDASGSMAGTSDVPSIVNIYVALANRLGVSFDSTTGYYTYQHVLLDENGDPQENENGTNDGHEHTMKTCSEQKSVEQTDAYGNVETIYYYEPSYAERRIDMEKFLKDQLITNGSVVQVCRLVSQTLGDGYEFTPDMWYAIADKKGAVANGTYVYPQRKSMIGYYEILSSSSNDYDGYRTWYYNSMIPGEEGEMYSYVAPSATVFKSYLKDDYFAQAVYPQIETTNDNNSFNFGENKEVIKHYSDFNKFSGFSSATSWNNVLGNYAGSSGLNLAGSQTGDSGFMLSAASTPSGSFTITFWVQFDNWGNTNAEILYIGSKEGTIKNADFRLVRKANKDIVLYHNGQETTLLTNNDLTSRQAFTFTYDKDTGNVTFYNHQNNSSSPKTVSVSNVEFKEGIECIVFDPFVDGGTGSNKFYVDDIIVYNTALTSSEVSSLVSARGHEGTNASHSADAKKTSQDAWNAAFLTAAELVLFMNPQNTAHVPLGVAAYNYFVATTDHEFYPLAYWDGKTVKQYEGKTFNNSDGYFAAMVGGSVLGELRNSTATTRNGTSGAGWYYLSHGSDYDILKTAGTNKRLFALYGGTVTDNVTMNTEYQWTAEVGADAADTGNSYSATTGSTVKFYIDGDGDLRCFYSTTGSAPKCSYVYEVEDSQYVKTEALQRILAYLSAEISEKTPSSQISAVQFSNTSRTSENLVVLDWSENADDIAAIMSQKYGLGAGETDETKGGDLGTANGWNMSAGGIKQYNFALTGSTSTYSGLQSFLNNIVLTDAGYKELYNSSKPKTETAASAVPSLDTTTWIKDGELTKYAKDKLETISGNYATYRRDDPDSPKFFIVFTDGADSSFYSGTNETGNNPTKVYAEILKELGYTVIGVYIPAGTDPRNEYGTLEEAAAGSKTQYGLAKRFLGTIASTDADGNPYVFASTDITTVANIFDSKIMASLKGFISGYTVEEYIDPRFDLKQADDTIWHLDANGEITLETAQTNGSTITVEIVGNSETFRLTYQADGSSYTLPYKLGGSDNIGVIFHLTGENSNGATRNPYLRYNAGKDMYYLEWPDQIIQSSPAGSTEMSPIRVWSAEYTLVAKEDFIGGDAVLTSGNEEKMNWIYHPADVDVNGYAQYVLNSWNGLSYDLKKDYVTKWTNLKNNNGLKNYQDDWDTLVLVDGVEKAHKNAWTQKPYDTAKSVWEEWFGTVEFDGTFITYLMTQLNLKRTTHYDANSDTSDATKTDEGTDANGNYEIDEFPSKGFPRIAVNVSPEPVLEDELASIIYLGEVMSPVLILNNMVGNNTTNWYLNYLMRYAYYLYPSATMPLIKLLKTWEGILAENGEKSMSVPYMYLPDVVYNADGTVQKVAGKAVQLNSTGTAAHQGDVLGILTYHWKQVKPANALNGADAKVVYEGEIDDWEMEYELTVEFTVFREEDTFDKVKSDCTLCEKENCDHVDVLSAQLIGEGTFETFLYDRDIYLNGGKYSIGETKESHEGLVKETAYKAKVYSAGALDKENESGDKSETTMAALAELMDGDEEKAAAAVSEGRVDKFYNEGRTQQVVFTYDPKVVGADLALELTIHNDWIGNAYWSNKTITIEVTRTFQDSDYAKGLKSSNNLADYGNVFTITYDFNGAEFTEQDAGGFYTVYAKASIKGYFGDSEEPIELTALPIGNYSFTKTDITDPTSFDVAAVIGSVTDASKYQKGLFGDRVGSLFSSDGTLNDAKNIAQTSGGPVTFYFGTTNGVRNYDSRLGMIHLTTSPLAFGSITIVETGGKENESFLYKVTDEYGNSIVVSVKGGRSTTIIVPIGTYTVEEISDWSWRYRNGSARGATGEGWTITGTVETGMVAKTTVEKGNAKTVTYSHSASGLPWLGGENYEDFPQELQTDTSSSQDTTTGQ